MNILITGASGFIGSNLIEALLSHKEFHIRALARNPEKTKSKFPSSVECYGWNPAKNEIDSKALEGVDVVINLAGENIASGRWSKDKKQKLISSRINGTKLLMANKNLDDGPNFEIILKGAKGGGGSWGVAAVAAAERYLGNHKLINNVMQQIVTRSIKAGEEKPIDYLWNNVKTVQNSPLCKDRFDDIVTEEQFREQLKAAREDQIHAKAFQAAMLAALVKASPKNRSLWLDWVINYAGSTLADSSVYLKAYMHEGQ